MSADPSLELQKAIRSLLIADSTLATLMGGTVKFFDHIPERESLPYIEYRQGQVQEWDTKPFDESGTAHEFGKEHTISINVWSSYEGVKELRQILRQVYDLLQDNCNLVLQDHNLVIMRYIFEDVVAEPDGQVFHGITQYRAVTEET